MLCAFINFIYLLTFVERGKKKNTELGVLLGLEPVSLVIENDRLRWFGHDEHEDDADWIKSCIMMDVSK